MKFIRKAVLLLFAISLFASLGVVSAKDNSQNLIADGSYNFPVKPGTQEWKSLTTKVEKLKKSQLPDGELAQFSTETLIETVLNYPLRSDLFAFSSYKEGFRAVLSNFNGLAELVKREDAGTKLLHKYRQINGFAVANNDDATMKLLVVKVLLSQNAFASKLTTQELEELQGVSDVSPFAAASATVSTPKGTKVSVLILGEELTPAQKTAIANDVKKSYPRAVFLSEATSNYNCHSYAWYSQSTSTNKYWMNDPSAYWTDGSYKKSTSGAKGYRIYYSTSGNEHTGIITTMYSGPPAPGKEWSSLTEVTSKWGKAGLYKHMANDCPYYVNESALRYYG